MTGDAKAAEKQYRAVDFIATLGDTQAQVYNRELVLFEAHTAATRRRRSPRGGAKGPQGHLRLRPPRRTLDANGRAGAMPSHPPDKPSHSYARDEQDQPNQGTQEEEGGIVIA